MAFNFQFPLLALQDPAAAARIAASMAPPPASPGATAGNLGRFVLPAPPPPGAPPVPTPSGAFNLNPPAFAGTNAVPSSGAFNFPAPPGPGVTNPLGTPPTVPEPQGPSLADKLKQSLGAARAVRADQPTQEAPPNVAPPGGRGMVLPQGSSQILGALQAALVPGAGTAIPSLGALIRGRR